MTKEERAEAKAMVQEVLQENRDRIRAEKAEAALQAANEAWDRAWEKAMPRYEKPKENTQTISGIIQLRETQEGNETGKEAGAWKFLYGVCAGALGVLIVACTIIMTQML